MDKSQWAIDSFEKVKEKPEFIATSIMIEINEIICSQMEKLRISQRELAKRTEKSQPFISRLLSHGTNTTVKTLVVIAQALDLTLDVKLKEKAKTICEEFKIDFQIPSTDEVKRMESKPYSIKKPPEEVNEKSTFGYAA